MFYRYNFGKIRITGANCRITDLIGNPIPIKNHVNDIVQNNAGGNAERKPLTAQQELFIYWKKDLAKLRLQRSKILNTKEPIEKFLEQGEKEEAEISRQMDHLKEKIIELKKKLIEKTQKIDEINEKIAFHSKGMN